MPGMRAINLFSGAGGWDIAARRLNINTTGIERKKWPVETARAAGFNVLHGDVTRYNPYDYIGYTPAGVTYQGLIASPPCQTFSAAGTGLGRAMLGMICTAIRQEGGDVPRGVFDERTGLVLEPLRWINARWDADIPYEWICLEQVSPVLPIWEAYADWLSGLGYGVVTGILSSEQFGVGQVRKRAVLIARFDKHVKMPRPTHSRYYPRDRTRRDPGVLDFVTMAQALGWGMDGRPSMTVCAGGTATGGAEIFGNGSRKGMRREFESGHWAHKRPSTSVNCDARIAQPGRHDPGVSGSQYGPATVRVTPAEAGVLQSFPADYPWQGPRTKQFEQVGNAIPPLLAWHVLREAIGG